MIADPHSKSTHDPPYNTQDTIDLHYATFLFGRLHCSSLRWWASARLSGSGEATWGTKLAAPPTSWDSAAARSRLSRRRLLLLLMPQRVVGIERVALLRCRRRTGFSIRSIAGILFVRRWCSGVCRRVLVRTVDGRARIWRSCACAATSSGAACATASTRWHSRRTTLVLSRNVLFRKFLFATALLLGLALAVLFFFLELKCKGKVVVFLFAVAAWCLVVVVLSREL